MYGWRGRIGVLLPSLNTVMEPEMNLMAPEGIAIYSNRLKVDDGEFTPEQLINMANDTERAAVDVKHVADLVVYGCTSGSFVKGLGWDSELTKRLQVATGKPAISTSTAVIEAVKRIGAAKVAIATPYTEEVNKRMKEFFETHDLGVVNILGLRNVIPRHFGDHSPSAIYKLAKEAYRRDAEALLISCTAFPSAKVIDPLEADLGIPVITSNQATMWYALSNLEVHASIHGFGILLSRHLTKDR